jgi:5-methyltetrahydrofolate--homocysteine methyltransferase
LCWLIDLVQETVEVPLCVDSPNPRIFEKVLPRVKRKNGIINSVSMEKDKCEIVFPLIEGTDWQVIALTCDNGGVSAEPNRKWRSRTGSSRKRPATASGPRGSMSIPSS